MTMIDGTPMVACDRCERMVPCGQQPEAMLPDHGLRITLGGYYAGFTDNCFEPDDQIVLCHDCSLWLWDSIPKLKDQRGLHPNRNGRCCNYWWGIDGEDVVFGDGTREVGRVKR